jgi:hypothetical protein
MQIGKNIKYMKSKMQHTSTVLPNNPTPQLSKTAQFRSCSVIVVPDRHKVEALDYVVDIPCCTRWLCRLPLLRCPIVAATPSSPSVVTSSVAAPMSLPPIHPLLPALTHPCNSVIQPSQHWHVVLLFIFLFLSNFNFYYSITRFYMQYYICFIVLSRCIMVLFWPTWNFVMRPPLRQI